MLVSAYGFVVCVGGILSWNGRSGQRARPTRSGGPVAVCSGQPGDTDGLPEHQQPSQHSSAGLSSHCLATLG